MRSLVPRTRRGVPNRRLCPLGVPREAMATRGPVRRLVPSFAEEYVELRSRADDPDESTSTDDAYPVRIGPFAFPVPRVGAIGS